MAKKKRHVVVVPEDEFLKWLATKVDKVTSAISRAPLGANVEDAIAKAEKEPPWDIDRTLLSGMSFNQDGSVTFIVVEVPPTRALKAL
jgi:hypothetical protein